jgi:hypothetical protein
MYARLLASEGVACRRISRLTSVNGNTGQSRSSITFATAATHSKPQGHLNNQCDAYQC